MKKFFELQTQLTSYTYPLIKIIVSVFILLFGLFRNQLFVISSKPLYWVITLLSLTATMLSVLCLYISIPELFYVYRNRKANVRKGKQVSSIPYDFDKVSRLAQENDIIDFEINTIEGTLRLGASADCKQSSSKFFDKRFYIGDKEYLAIEEFEADLLKYAETGKINVVSIDGVKAGKYESRR